MTTRSVTNVVLIDVKRNRRSLYEPEALPVCLHLCVIHTCFDAPNLFLKSISEEVSLLDRHNTQQSIYSKADLNILSCTHLLSDSDHAMQTLMRRDC